MVEPEKIHKQYLWVTSVSAVVLLLLFIVFLGAVRSNGVAPQHVRLDKGWTVTYKGEKTEIESLVNYTFPKNLKSGDSLILEGIIPARFLSNSIFRFRTAHTAVEVFENDKSVYEYGKNRAFPIAKSSSKSSLSSIPTLTRTRSSVTPARTFSSSVA